MNVAHTLTPTLRSISYRVVVRCFLAVFFTRHNFVHAGFFQSVQLFLLCLLRSFVTRVFALGSSGRPSSFNSQFSRCLRSRSRSFSHMASCSQVPNVHYPHGQCLIWMLLRPRFSSPTQVSRQHFPPLQSDLPCPVPHWYRCCATCT